MSAPVVVAEWPRNSREVIRVSLSEYEGRRIVDVRVWYADRTGDMKPGRAGLTLGIAHLEKLADALAGAVVRSSADEAA